MRSKFLTVVRLDPQAGGFVIGSPDFPDLAVNCEALDELVCVATAAIRGRLDKLRAEGRASPHPTPKTELETRVEYRECFLIGVEAEEHRSGV